MIYNPKPETRMAPRQLAPVPYIGSGFQRRPLPQWRPANTYGVGISGRWQQRPERPYVPTQTRPAPYVNIAEPYPERFGNYGERPNPSGVSGSNNVNGGYGPQNGQRPNMNTDGNTNWWDLFVSGPDDTSQNYEELTIDLGVSSIFTDLEVTISLPVYVEVTFK